MEDFLTIRKYLEGKNLSYFTFFHKSEKPIKAVRRHLHLNTPAQDISDGLTDLGFDIISVKQMTSTRRSPSEGSVPRNLPLFLITLPRTAKSQEIFRLTALCHISIGVEAYRAQNALTQCHNCQRLGHVWANCKQPPRCLWCGGSHLHKECPEKDNAASTPACCNCHLAEGEKPHPATYRGCRHAREELQRRKAQKTPKTVTGNGEGVLLKPHHTRRLLRGCAPRQCKTAATEPSGTPLSRGRSSRRSKSRHAGFWASAKTQVSQSGLQL
jgi:hypothetical protein